MKPIILMTAGLEDTKRQIKQLHIYENYGACISRAGGIPLMPCVDEQQSLQQTVDLADGLYLSGGEDLEPWRYGVRDTDRCTLTDPWRDNLELQLCELFVAKKKPIFGICRGMQLLNTYFGGSLIVDLKQDKGIDHPYHSIHPVTTIESSWLEKTYGNHFLVNSYHHQAVNRLGKDLIPIAFSESDNVIEAIVHAELPVMAVQWHPERMTGPERYDTEGPDMGIYFQHFCELCKENHA